jgi:hypothetical protein
VLDGLFVAPAVAAIGEALASAHAEGTIAVLGNARIAKGLATSREVVTDLAAQPPGSLAAVVGMQADVSTLRDWSRVVRDGGAIVLVDRGPAADASRKVLCAGLTELEQRHAGRTVVTSGLVSHL